MNGWMGAGGVTKVEHGDWEREWTLRGARALAKKEERGAGTGVGAGTGSGRGDEAMQVGRAVGRPTRGDVGRRRSARRATNDGGSRRMSTQYDKNMFVSV